MVDQVSRVSLPSVSTHRLCAVRLQLAAKLLNLSLRLLALGSQ